MAKLNVVNKARKDDKKNGIKRGDKYYWWKFRFGPVHKSKTMPRRSQLTQSDFLGQVYDLEDEIEEAEEITQDMIDGWVSTLEQLRDECQDKLNNMPEQLQDNSSSGQLLQERVDSLDSWISDLQSVDADVDEDALHQDAVSEIDESEYTDENGNLEESDYNAAVEDKFEELKEERISDIKDEVSSANPGF